MSIFRQQPDKKAPAKEVKKEEGALKHPCHLCGPPKLFCLTSLRRHLARIHSQVKMRPLCSQTDLFISALHRFNPTSEQSNEKNLFNSRSFSTQLLSLSALKKAFQKGKFSAKVELMTAISCLPICHQLYVSSSSSSLKDTSGAHLLFDN